MNNILNFLEKDIGQTREKEKEKKKTRKGK